MQLYALADLHVNHQDNRETLAAIPPHPDDWLILAGDLGETETHLRWTFEVLVPKWKRVLWVPGNHELWTPPREEEKGGTEGRGPLHAPRRGVPRVRRAVPRRRVRAVRRAVDLPDVPALRLQLRPPGHDA